MQVTVTDMGLAREARARRQAALLSTHACLLLCLTMNIAGPLKQSPLIQASFEALLRQVTDLLKAAGLPVLHQECLTPHTGPEAYLVVSAPALHLKRLAVQLEDRDRLGRLMDLDVLEPSGNKLSRGDLQLPQRSCLICGQPGRACAAGRVHSAEALYEEACRIMRHSLLEQGIAQIANVAVKALLWELSASPKPGLVDRHNNGAHQDMNFFTFLDSATALQPYFARAARLGASRGMNADAFFALRAEGMLAEGEMLRATRGVNTHKGAIFTLGILCAAAGHLLVGDQPFSKEALSSAAISLTADSLIKERKNLQVPKTYGERRMQHGLSGARAEAAAGFPSVMETGFMALDRAFKNSDDADKACLEALYAIMQVTEDTVLLRRAEERGCQNELASLLESLKSDNRPSPEQLDARFNALGLSPGGSADLLAASLFVLNLLKLQLPPLGVLIESTSLQQQVE